MIRLPLTLTGEPKAFAKAVESHRKALRTHMMGRPGKPAPIAPDIVMSVIERRPQEGPVDSRGPDEFVILPYEIVDDLPVPPEVQLLRDSIKQGA